MRIGRGMAVAFGLMSLLNAGAAEAQVQFRLGVPGRATYSELHDGLRAGTPRADSMLRVLRIQSPRRLWRIARTAMDGNGDWNAGLVALTHLAELRSAAYADSARRLRARLEQADGPPFPHNPGLVADDITPSLQAIILERRRATVGDSAVLADILSRLASKQYDHGDAWVLGRLGAGAKDSLWARLRAADNEEFRVRYLTLLSYFTDPALIPDLARVYAEAAVPGEGLRVPIYILGSSLFGAQVAAAMGLPFAFASHFAAAMMLPAIELYRASFRPSAHLVRSGRALRRADTSIA